MAKPVLEADSHTKVQMRKKVRGLRKSEQAVLKQRRTAGAENRAAPDPEGPLTPSTEPAHCDPPPVDCAGDVVTLLADPDCLWSITQLALRSPPSGMTG